MYGLAERSFFSINTPIPCNEVQATKTAIDNYVFPALKARDFSLLKIGLFKLTMCGFKKLEISNQSRSVKLILENIARSPNLAGGMSSLGPAIFVIGNETSGEEMACIREMAERGDAENIATEPMNAGAMISHDE